MEQTIQREYFIYHNNGYIGLPQAGIKYLQSMKTDLNDCSEIANFYNYIYSKLLKTIYKKASSLLSRLFLKEYFTCDGYTKNGQELNLIF